MPARASAKSASAKEVLYLYAVTPADEKVARIAAVGADGSSHVHSVACGEYLAWVSRVPASDFGDNLEGKMEDLDWLAAASVRHQRVVAELGEHATVLPARFGTVFKDEQSLWEHVIERSAELKAALEHVSGADEWGVKVFRVQQRSSATTTAASGADYLKQKAARLHEQSRTPAELPPEVAALASELQKLVRDSGPGGSVSRGQPNLVWQAALLLPRSAKEKFDSAVRRFAAASTGALRIEVTGPWPPYSFVKHGR